MRRHTAALLVALVVALVGPAPVMSWCTVGDAGCPAVAAPAFGTSNYVEYRAGRLPVVLSVPHGGSITTGATDIPNDRQPGCYDAGTDTCVYEHSCGTTDSTECPAKTLKDTYTLEMAEEMSDAMLAEFGERPHMVISHLHRSKLDPNRDLGEATLGVPAAVVAYNEFHTFLADAVAAATTDCGLGLVIDMHGQTHSEQWIELGYGVPSSRLDGNAGEALSTASPGTSSFDALLASPRTTNGNSMHKVLRGANSLGARLQALGYNTVPSDVNPGPSGGGYFSGGFITKRWGLAAEAPDANAAKVDSVQAEINRDLRFGGNAGHVAFATAFATSLDGFFNSVYGVELSTGAGCPAQPKECSSDEVPNSFWVDGSVWDTTCSPALHGACPPADAANQMSYTPPGGSQLTLTRRLDGQQGNMMRQDQRC